MKTFLTKKMYGGLRLIGFTIQSHRSKLLNDPEVIELMRIARMSLLQGEDFETMIRRLKTP